MTYAIDPHLAFSDRLARTLRQRQVPTKNCRINDVWTGFVQASRAYPLWPEARTVYHLAFSHEDSAKGPISTLSWITYFEHVNLRAERTLITATLLCLSTPLETRWMNTTFTLKSSAHATLNQWLSAVQKHEWMNHIARTDKRWLRQLSTKTFAN